MSARSVNKVILIGNLTRDPELRYTPQGTPVVSFGLATNREWSVEGVKKEAADFHNVVAWNKLAEICDQLLSKGAKTYVEGRLQTRDWVDGDGNKRYKTEVVINEMIVLTSKRNPSDYSSDSEKPYEAPDAVPAGEAVVEDSDEIDLDKVLSEDFGVETTVEETPEVEKATEEVEEVEDAETEEKETKKKKTKAKK
ncbi:single-stranded DNA-binding protein [Patescibacteria group bacterium]